MPYRYAGLHPVEHAGSPAGVVRPGEIRDEPIEDFGPWTELPADEDVPLPLDVPPGDPVPPPEPPPAPAAPSASAPKRATEGEK